MITFYGWISLIRIVGLYVWIQPVSDDVQRSITVLQVQAQYFYMASTIIVSMTYPIRPTPPTSCTTVIADKKA